MYDLESLSLQKKRAMPSKIIKKTGSKLIIEVSVDLDSDSMLNSEEQIQAALNQAGQLATKEALSNFDTDGSPIKVSNNSYTSKGKKKGNMKAAMGR